jgi:perosamine synthetase
MIKISSPVFDKEEIDAVTEVLNSGNLSQGKKVQEFEEKFSGFIGKKYGIATSSGTSALQIAMKSLGLGKGDEVITTPFTFAATTNSILFTGAKPVFADIDERSFNLNPDLIKEKITDKTKALVVVHLYGNPCEMGKILRICRDHNLKLIEDCAQSTGSAFGGRNIGSFGNASCFSFYPTKNMTTGEGGMILTDNSEIERKCRLYRNHGQIETYEHIEMGFNFRMTDIAASIGICQLAKLGGLNEKRIQNAYYLNDHLKNVYSHAATL